MNYYILGGGFKNIFIFTPILGEPILTSIFFKWVGEKPPTSIDVFMDAISYWNPIGFPALFHKIPTFPKVFFSQRKF